MESEEEQDPNKETDVALQKRLKKEFLMAADASDDELELKPIDEPKHQNLIDKNFVEKQEFWNSKADKKLSKEDLFLKNYILSMAWKQKPDSPDPMVDEEDEQREDEMDNYERAYNFRFEEPGGAQI